MAWCSDAECDSSGVRTEQLDDQSSKIIDGRACHHDILSSEATCANVWPRDPLQWSAMMSSRPPAAASRRRAARRTTIPRLSSSCANLPAIVMAVVRWSARTTLSTDIVLIIGLQCYAHSGQILASHKAMPVKSSTLPSHTCYDSPRHTWKRGLGTAHSKDHPGSQVLQETPPRRPLPRCRSTASRPLSVGGNRES
jgi:hypothetical protein